ncbi:MAG: hypothetical protein ABI844_10130 [Saprospiraceae bacterium]
MQSAGFNVFDENVQPSVLYPEYKSTILRAPSKALIVIAWN